MRRTWDATMSRASASTNAFLIAESLPVSTWQRRIGGAMQVGAFTALIALAAQVRVVIPGTVVPMTLQSAAVLLAALTLSPSRAVAATLAYVLGGAAGLPLFAPGSAGLFGPTGGYLCGFVAAAWAASLVKGNRPGIIRLATAGVVGMGVLFALGATWLSVWTKQSAIAALMTGVVPFLSKAALEVLLAATIARMLGAAANRVSGSRGRSMNRTPKD